MDRKFPIALIAIFALLMVPGCGFNTMQGKDEAVKAAWAEVLNQYQRRFDLVPNLVNTVQGYASHEKEVLEAVTRARAQVGSITASPDLINNESALNNFIAAQNNMSGALSRLLVVVENYPQLKADNLFRDLQAQLEGTENRITVSRNRFIGAVQDYNVVIRTFPNLITAKIFGYKTKPTFTVQNEPEIAKPPAVNFNKK
jgi:LemA protein